jgi:hypothetical protein
MARLDIRMARMENRGATREDDLLVMVPLANGSDPKCWYPDTRADLVQLAEFPKLNALLKAYDLIDLRRLGTTNEDRTTKLAGYHFSSLSVAFILLDGWSRWYTTHVQRVLFQEKDVIVTHS